MDTLRALLDDLLEILVIPSFTRLGHVWRRQLWDWDDVMELPMHGRTVLITGPTSGLGREAAAMLSTTGARLVLVGRDADRLAATARELEPASSTAGGSITTAVADMSSLASVRATADRILAEEPRLDVIIDNAGGMFAERQETDEGFERTFALMVLGPWVLTARLLPRLLQSDDPRLVAVTSGGQYTQALPLDDLLFERAGYDGPRAYARAKRAQVALVREWARRVRQLTANAMHPGWADTPGLEASLPGFREIVGGLLRTAREGIDTAVWLAASPAGRRQTGRLFLDRRARPFDRVPATRLGAEDRQELWRRVVALTDEADPTPS
jgi:dehydrogenase/reductase SDR family protein 12